MLEHCMEREKSYPSGKWCVATSAASMFVNITVFSFYKWVCNEFVMFELLACCGNVCVA